MSVPRFAIQRPVMMAMISCIIVLLGAISLSRLPVDLLPDISQPTVNVRVTYTGVGPLEMEELVTRPLEQQLSDDFSVLYITDVTSAQQQTIQAEWNISSRLSVVGVRDQNGLLGVNFQITLRFR